MKCEQNSSNNKACIFSNTTFKNLYQYTYNPNQINLTSVIHSIPLNVSYAGGKTRVTTKINLSLFILNLIKSFMLINLNPIV